MGFEHVDFGRLRFTQTVCRDRGVKTLRQQRAVGGILQPVEQLPHDAEARRRDAAVTARKRQQWHPACGQVTVDEMGFEAKQIARAGRAPWETPSEFMRAALARLPVPAPPVERLTTLFELARFSLHPLESPERDLARACLEEIRAALARAEEGAPLGVA